MGNFDFTLDMTALTDELALIRQGYLDTFAAMALPYLSATLASRVVEPPPFVATVVHDFRAIRLRD